MSRELEARLAILEAQVGEVREQLARAKAARAHTMRMSHRCPACGGGRLFHFKRVKELSHATSTVDLSLQKQAGWWGVRLNAGIVEAFACRDCRLVEWHAVSLDDVEPDGVTVVAIDEPEEPTVDDGPYR